MTPVDTWRAWLVAHGVPDDPSNGSPPIVLATTLNERLGKLGTSVPADIRAAAYRSTAALAPAAQPLSPSTLLADHAWFAWLAASSSAQTRNPTVLEALSRFTSWLGTFPSAGQVSTNTQDQLLQWSDTFSHIAETTQDTSGHGLGVLANSLQGFLDLALKPVEGLLTGISNLLWGLLGFGVLAMGLGALVLFSGGGQLFLASVGAGYGSALASVGAGSGAGIASALPIVAGAPVVFARGLGAGIAAWPEALRFLPFL